MLKDFYQYNLVKNHGILINISLHVNKIHWECQFYYCFNPEKRLYSLNYRNQLIHFICYFFNQKYQIQIFPNTLKMTFLQIKEYQIFLRCHCYKFKYHQIHPRTPKYWDFQIFTVIWSDQI